MKLILLMAMTADGIIARDSRHFPDWTGTADKRMFKKMTMDAGVVIMGRRTFQTIGKALPRRLNIVMTRYPEKQVSADNLIFTNDAPGQLLKKISQQGYQKAILAGGATINSLFMRENLIDEMVITVIPKLFGQGISMFAEMVDQRITLSHSYEIEPGVLVLHYKFESMR